MAKHPRSANFEIHWARTTCSNLEFDLVTLGYIASLQFLRSIKDVAPQYEGPENAKKYRTVVSAIIMNVWDGFLTGQDVIAEKNLPALEYAAELGITWEYIDNAISALGGLRFLVIKHRKLNAENENESFCIAVGKELGTKFKERKRDALDDSNPLDVHKWSDYPEVNDFVDKIYKDHFEYGNIEIQKSITNYC